MIKHLTQYLNYGIFAEIALVIFAAVFVAIVIRTLLTSRQEMSQQASIVLDEGTRLSTIHRNTSRQAHDQQNRSAKLKNGVK